jgi:hypothetical protein
MQLINNTEGDSSMSNTTEIAEYSPIAPSPDKAAEYTAKLIAKIESLPHQGEAHAILASEAVSKKINQLHESRPELEKAIYTAVNALPVLPDPEQPPLTIAALLTLLDGAETEEDAQDVMLRPEVESLDAESMTKLSERYRATVARVSA